MGSEETEDDPVTWEEFFELENELTRMEHPDFERPPRYLFEAMKHRLAILKGEVTVKETS